MQGDLCIKMYANMHIYIHCQYRQVVSEKSEITGCSIL